MTNWKDKANIFNDFLSKKFSKLLIQNFETSKRLSTTDTNSKKILKLIQGLNSKKAHWMMVYRTEC